MSVTRRGFLAGSAAAAAAPKLIGAAPAATTECHGPDAAPLRLWVNGKAAELTVEPRTTLLEAVRWQLGLTGPKEVCGRGACGACTVLVDGKPVLGCLSLAIEMEGRRVETVEGLGSPQEPGRVQEAMIRHDAVQCGYCIPGFVMSLEGALRRDPQSTEAQLREALAGNLCRCGTYNKVFEAAARLAGGDPAAGLPARNARACVESELSRVDGPEKITGRAVYSADAARPGMLFAQHIPCPYAGALLEKADVDTARRLPGVREVVVETGKEYRYSGAPIGHVCAESPAALRDALTALNLRWELRFPLIDPLQLHEEQHGPYPPSAEVLARMRNADEAAAALKRSAVVIERSYRTQVQTHSSLEPHGAMVDPTTDPPEGWVSTQATFSCQAGVAQGLGRSQKEVAIKCDYVGGGFGSKFGAGREGLLAAQLAAKYGVPVRVFNDREYEHLDTGNRPGSLQWMKIGADGEGRIQGGFVYVADLSGLGGRGGGANNPARYDFGAIARRAEIVNLPHGAPRPFRAPGHPQGMFAVESMMDELAEALGLDPIEMRLRNEQSDLRREMYPVGAAEIGWQRRQPTGAQRGRLRRGFGVASGDWGNRPGRPGGCDIRMTALPDGRVQVFSGTQDIGTGQRTVLADLAAEALGLPRSLVEVHMADSRLPFGPGSGGSVTARFTAPAVYDTAAKLLQAMPQLEGRRASGAASWASLCGQLPEAGLSVEGTFNRDYWGEGESDCVQFAEVLVDTETGVVKVEKIVAVQSCGRAVNRLTAENQIIGGVIQGVSFALFEDKVADPQAGYQLNADLLQYKIAGALDVPEIVPLLWGDKEGLGVRSLGEPTTIPTAGAIANAVANALGARVRELPITPERVLAAMEEKA